MSYPPTALPSNTPQAARNAHLGPGAYDYKRQKDVVISPFLQNRPLSSMASRTPRFGAKRGGGLGGGLGSTWTQVSGGGEVGWCP